jgi:hypothetical protein
MREMIVFGHNIKSVLLFEYFPAFCKRISLTYYIIFLS